MNDFMTVQEVADELRVSKMTVYRLIKDGELASTTIGKRTYRVRRSTLNRYLGVEPPADA